ncbi:hypothetical protein niasHT_039971 [Heterodera trifolii]|uniref:Uncharacterized protein n=1 Tax=Heterodera trifolii TaxID=157864 RepID=A0ABD2J264_9BILA
MVFVKCSSIFPSNFAVLLLLCVISVLLEHGHALKCKDALNTEIFVAIIDEKKTEEMCSKATHCMAMFCSSAENGFFINMWGCTDFGTENKTTCEKESPDNANKIRAVLESQYKMRSPTATDWKCTCHFGAKDKDMDNEQFVAPVVEQKPKALKCKFGMEWETFEISDNEIKEMHKKEVCSNATHCIAFFCSSAENGFFINMWSCVPLGAEDTEAKCEKESPNEVNGFRANLSAPAATDWKCMCHFGAKGKDMDNEQFVAPAPPEGKSTSSRHGVGMPLMAIGLFIGFLPLFRGAIFDRLNDLLEVNKF